MCKVTYTCCLHRFSFWWVCDRTEKLREDKSVFWQEKYCCSR